MSAHRFWLTPACLGIALCTVNTFWPARGPKAIRYVHAAACSGLSVRASSGDLGPSQTARSVAIALSSAYLWVPTSVCPPSGACFLVAARSTAAWARQDAAGHDELDSTNPAHRRGDRDPRHRALDCTRSWASAGLAAFATSTTGSAECTVAQSSIPAHCGSHSDSAGNARHRLRRPRGVTSSRAHASTTARSFGGSHCTRGNAAAMIWFARRLASTP